MDTKYLIFRIWLFVFYILIPVKLSGAIEYAHQKDVVYGYKNGMALVLDVYSPETMKNGAAVITIMAGGMRSSPYWSHNADNNPIIKGLIEAGYVVFAVAHSSQPKFTIEEIRLDISRAVRFIRHNSEEFEIDPQKIGIMGKSSGGQIALMAALAPTLPDTDSWDKVEHESAELQAVVAYFPGTDLLNFGQENTNVLDHFHSIGNNRINAAFDFHKWDQDSGRYERIIDLDVQNDIYKQNSPLTWVSKDDPPVLLFHGNKDQMVPIQQSQVLVSRFNDFNIINELVVMEGLGHGWEKPQENELTDILNWYNLHLLSTNH